MGNGQESVKELWIKNELIKNDFPEPFLSENKPGFFGKSLFTQQKIAVTIKQMGVSYRKVLILANKVGVVKLQQRFSTRATRYGLDHQPLKAWAVV